MSHFLFTVRLWAEKSGDLMQTSGGVGGGMKAGSEKNGKPNGAGKRNGTEQRKFGRQEKQRDERRDIKGGMGGYRTDRQGRRVLHESTLFT